MGVRWRAPDIKFRSSASTTGTKGFKCLKSRTMVQISQPTAGLSVEFPDVVS